MGFSVITDSLLSAKAFSLKHLQLPEQNSLGFTLVCPFIHQALAVTPAAGVTALESSAAVVHMRI